MERTQVKLTVKKSFSIAKAQALARQAQIATESTKNVVVAAGESYSSSPSRVHLNTVSFEDDAHFGIADAAAASQMPIARTTQGDGSYFRRISQESCTMTSFRTSARTCDDESTNQAARRTEHTGLVNRFEVEPSSTGVTGDLTVQPFDDDEVEYLSSIFEQDKQISHEEDLSSILSLDRDGTVEDFNL